MARPWEDTRRKLDAGPKQKFFRKPSKSSFPEPANEKSERLAKRTYGRKPIPEPTNQTKLWNGTRKSMESESEPESKRLAKRTNGSQSRVPSPNRNINKGRMGEINEPGRHVVDIRNSEKNTKGTTKKMVYKTIQNETKKKRITGKQENARRRF